MIGEVLSSGNGEYHSWQGKGRIVDIFEEDLLPLKPKLGFKMMTRTNNKRDAITTGKACTVGNQQARGWKAALVRETC